MSQPHLSEQTASLWHISRDAEAECALLCFPHSGGGPWSFRGLARRLPKRIETIAFQLPSTLESREPGSHQHLTEIVEWAYPAVRDLAARPLAIYGHSLGALLAFEMARKLEGRDGKRLLGLIVSGRRAPHRPPRRTVHHLPDADLLHILAEMGGVPSALLESPRWQDRYLPRIRTELALSDSYRYDPGPSIGCPLQAYCGEQDPIVERSDWEAWAIHASHTFRSRLLPGAHFFSRAGEALLAQEVSLALRTHSRPSPGQPARFGRPGREVSGSLKAGLE